MPELNTRDAIHRVLLEARTIAILGAHPNPVKAAHYVPQYLHEQGYRILPVNSTRMGLQMWGQPVRASLTELGEPIDIVDVFRRSEAVMGHLDEILAMNPRPKLVWLQQDIRDDVFADALMAQGIDVVQDRCTLADHRALGIPPCPPD